MEDIVQNWQDLLEQHPERAEFYNERIKHRTKMIKLNKNRLHSLESKTRDDR